MGDPSGGDGRRNHGAPRSRWWTLALLVPLALAVAMATPASPVDVARISFAGTPARWAAAVARAGADTDEQRAALAIGVAFGAVFGVIGAVLATFGLRSWAPARRQRFGWWRLVPGVCAAAGALWALTAGVQLAAVGDVPSRFVTATVAVAAWWTVVAMVVALVGLGGVAVGPAFAPLVRPLMRRMCRPFDGQLGARHDDAPPGTTRGAVPTHAAAQSDGESIGICASGGGIRSASVVLGALRGLAAAGTFQRTRWLHAVSGGGFTAAGWRVSSVARDEVDLFAAGHPWFESVRRRRRYLDNGFGSLVGGVAGAIARTVFVFGGVLAATVALGWGLGWLVATWAVHDRFSNFADDDATTWAELTAARLVAPGAVLVAIAVVCFLVGRTRADEHFRQRLDRIGYALAAVGLGLLVVLVGVPMWIRYGRPILDALVGTTAEVNAGFLGLLSAIGVLTAVRKLLTSELKRRWSRLGGIALAFGLALLAGKVADDRANGGGLFASWWWLAVAVAWLVVLDIPPSHRLTLNGVYRKRLAATFCLGPGDSMPLPAVAYSAEPSWAAYRGAPGPQLVVCGTSHATKRQHGGVRSLGFTFQAEGVTLHDRESARWADYPTGSWWDGYPRGWIVSRAMALSGAAFASAMGRQSFGSTNALLAAFNLRLGMWVPNPRYPDWFCDRGTSPRVHLGYFAKELFNRYHPDRDPFVYVADGGHRENLGLVEQLREQPALSIVIDASGDRPGTFGTLKQAIALASVELGAEVDIDFAPIAPRPDDEPLDCVTTGRVTHADGSVGQLVYAKAQVSDRTPLDVRQFAATNPPFPDYSTGDQYLRVDEFDALVAFGEHLADRIAVALATLPASVPAGEGE